MLRHLASYMKGYELYAFLSPVFVSLETVCQMIIPLLMANIIAGGIEAEYMPAVWKYGALMVVVALIASVVLTLTISPSLALVVVILLIMLVGMLVYTELRGAVRLSGVDFSYVEGKPVLKKMSVYADPGQKIAFVGSTGAGKTTVTNRFYEIQGGVITCDGIDVKDIEKDSLRLSQGSCSRTPTCSPAP